MSEPRCSCGLVAELRGKTRLFNPVGRENLDDYCPAQLKIESLKGSRTSPKWAIDPIAIGNKLWQLISPKSSGFQTV
jgi:hypothetical protein